MVFFLFVFLSSQFLPFVVFADETPPSLCVEGDVFVTPETAGFALGQQEQSRAEAAMDWIYSMTQPLEVASDGGSIVMDQLYEFDYTSSVSGSFSLEAPAEYPLVNTSPLLVSDPVDLSDSYRGVVQGSVSGVSLTDTHHVRAYLFTDQEYEQSAVVPGVVGRDGSWSLDLSSVPVRFAGAWRFRLYKVSTDEQVGESWPQPDILENLDIALFSVTDAEYPTGRQRAFPAGVYTFQNSFTGTKRVKLIDTNGTSDESDDRVLATSTAGTGLVRSYHLEPGDEGYNTPFQERSYMYDQALALSSAISLSQHDRAHDLAAGLLGAQQAGGDADGAFFFSTFQLAPMAGDTIFRTGAHAIATYSLLHYIQEYPQIADLDVYQDSAQRALDYIERLRSETGPQTGLYLGGSGRYVADIYQDYTIPWASTEHNLDVWHTFKKAGRVIDSRYNNLAYDLSDVLVEKLWNTETQRFYQGHGPVGPDLADALDTSSWGSMMLAGIYDFEKAYAALDRLSIYEFTDEETNISGWGPYADAAGYPGATPTVWYEGSFGVVMAYARNNLPDLYRAALDDLSRGQLDTGAFRYATDQDVRYEIITAPSVASTAWYILATIGRDDFWQECSYQTPASTIVSDVDTSSRRDIKGSSRRRRVCTDISALNYQESRFASSDNSLCIYAKEKSLESIEDSEQASINKTADSFGLQKNISVTSGQETPFVEGGTIISDNPGFILTYKKEGASVGAQPDTPPKESLDDGSFEAEIEAEVEQEEFDYTPSILTEIPEDISLWMIIQNIFVSFLTNIISLFR